MTQVSVILKGEYTHIKETLTLGCQNSKQTLSTDAEKSISIFFRSSTEKCRKDPFG